MASAAPAARGRPSIARLIFVFAKIGLLSFGGGSSTLVLMQQECMERTRWLSADDFAFTYALSRMYPGIHLVAQAVLIGYLLRGLMGAMACSLGMMVPSSLVTIVFTIFFVQLTSNPIGGAVLDGVLPATAGLTLAVGYRLTTEEITGRRWPARLATLAVIAGCFLALSTFGVNSALVVVLSGVVGVVLFRLIGGAHGPA
jgi:chromate transporter